MDYNNLKFILVCHFGLEKVLKNEVRKLGLSIDEVVDGEVRAIGSIKDIPRLNINLRTCERVLIEISNFTATTFEELFQNAHNSNIEMFVPIDGSFNIAKANQDKNSILHSSQSIQSIVKKAFVERLKTVYNTSVLTEDKEKYNFRVKFNKNICSIRLDTTGDSLHKRGYRIKSGIAPIEETLAASLIKITDFTDTLVDPFCGSGTIPIEAAMIRANIPPSLDRAFISEPWGIIPKKYWNEAIDEAKDNIDTKAQKDKYCKIYAFDIDKKMINISIDNAKRAGVHNLIDFRASDVKDFYKVREIQNLKNIIIVTNPPYGERLNDKLTIKPIYENFKKSIDVLKNNSNLKSLNIITAYEEIKKIFGRETKNRKIYNGMIKTYFYTYEF